MIRSAIRHALMTTATPLLNIVQIESDHDCAHKPFVLFVIGYTLVINCQWCKPQPATIPPSDNRAHFATIYAQSQGEQMKKALANCTGLRLSVREDSVCVGVWVWGGGKGSPDYLIYVPCLQYTQEAS